MIKIDYNDITFSAEISTNEVNELWNEIRYVYQYSDGFQGSKKSFIIPWNVFINRLDEFKYYTKDNDSKIKYTDRALRLVNYAYRNIKMYLGHNTVNIMPIKDIQRSLYERDFRRKLKPYQMSNLQKLLSFDSGATFSVPGAGKTTVALAFACLKSEPGDSLIVIAPLNAFPAWDREIQACYKDKSLEFTPIESTNEREVRKLLDGNPGRYILNYHKLPKLRSVLARFLASNPTILCLDESHYIKSENSKRGLAATSLAHLPKAKLIMSGTPVPQQIEDLVPQFKYLYPEIPVSPHDVRDKLQPIFVRTPRSALKIPDGEIIQTNLPMSHGQQKIYSLLKDRILHKYDYGLASDLEKIKKSVLLILQLVSNPLLLLSRFETMSSLPSHLLDDLESVKIDYACLRVRQLAHSGFKSIIWSSFVSNVDTITSRLADLNSVKIRGGIPVGERKRAVDQFNNNPDCFAIVINPASGSEGISLHDRCHHAIYIDRTFNSVHWLQSQDRIRRIGQKEAPKFELLIHEGTIDDRIQDRLDQKISMMEGILNDPSIRAENITVQFIEDEDYEFDERMILDNEDIEFALTAL